MLHAPQCKPFATPPFAARPAQITAAAAPRCKLHYLQSDASRRRQRGLCATWRVRDTGLAGQDLQGQEPFNSYNTNSNCEWNHCYTSSWILCNSFNALAALPFERRRRPLHENELHFALCHGIKRCLGVSLGEGSALLSGLSLPRQLAAIFKVASR